MSWKGFQKGFTRAPQQFKQRFNMGEITKDAFYLDAERRFADLEKETKALHDESTKYFKAINGMLDHQIEFSQACAEIYKPISGRASDPDSFYDEVGNAEGIRACEEYEAIVNDLKASLAPELEMIESRIVKPADELMEIIKVVRKQCVKRDHKQLDYDRHRNALKKLEDKKDKSLKDEKAIYKAENDVEVATQEYNYFNDLLKGELPTLFKLERDFIIPLFQSFYYMQLNVFYTLHDKMQNMDIGYFNLTLGIEEAFEMKRGDIQQQTEALSITKFRTTGGPRKPPHLRYGQNRLENRTERLAITNGKAGEAESGASSPVRGSTYEAQDSPPPAYSPVVAESAGGLGRANSLSAAAKSKAAPPAPKKSSALTGHPVVYAMYDFSPIGPDDLAFEKGDEIKVLKQESSAEAWWQGELNGRTGVFPGNYVTFNKAEVPPDDE